MRFGAFMVAALLVSGFAAYAQTKDQTSTQGEKKQEEQKSYIYQWTDGKGVVHITDDLNKIPTSYRSNARRLESTPGGEAVQSQPSQEGVNAPFGDSEEHELQADQKEAWQKRLSMEKKKLADAEQRYHELENRRNLLLQSWGGVASGRIEDRVEADRIDQEMQKVQQEINDARNQIEVVIPNEARKAGVPPGWLRE